MDLEGLLEDRHSHLFDFQGAVADSCKYKVQLCLIAQISGDCPLTNRLGSSIFLPIAASC
jgi:hypothetical protein